MITYQDLRKFCYSNDQLITAPIKGICLDFFGLNNTAMFWEDSERAVKFAQQGIIYVRPYLNPWAWMNRQGVEITDRIVDAPSVTIIYAGASLLSLVPLSHPHL